MSQAKKTKKPKRDPNEISPLVAEAVASVLELCDQLKAGVPIEQIARVTILRRPVEATEYGPDELKDLREKLSATQADLCSFLRVSLPTLRSWEQGQRKCPKVVCRYLDDIQAYPQIWSDKMAKGE
ncbi:MAG: hypothetical protein ABS79_06930 [Planctomycetes bacterium SCN 63-9]|nr:MAG: hypothetical protein ABS79_06930 [Planctomycetes bacterium SCN 63-9]